MTMMQPALPKKAGNYFTQHWRGELSLPKSFWINLVCVNLILNAISRIGGGQTSFSSEAEAAGYQFGFLLVGALVAVWQYTGVWRSATNYQKAGKPAVWAILAKIAIGLGIVVYIGVAILIFRNI